FQAVLDSSRHVVSYSYNRTHTVLVEYIPDPAKDMFQAVLDSSRHVVSYSYNRTHTVLVEYIPDPAKDMFQVGRSSEEQIDFTIVDTWLAAGSNVVLSPAGNNVSVQRLLRAPNGGLNGGEVIGQRPISSTISRYACRILIDRDQPHTARLYAAGFDASRNIFLGVSNVFYLRS
uniref:LAM_G_DOMAIN domain-containing protein n=1 Tax=Ascaris lumbricoides TaxID=6252 RepID=A0A0M3IKZ9_ASCLU